MTRVIPYVIISTAGNTIQIQFIWTKLKSNRKGDKLGWEQMEQLAKQRKQFARNPAYFLNPNS
jgi:hypothetical protein